MIFLRNPQLLDACMTISQSLAIIMIMHNLRWSTCQCNSV